MPVATNMSVNGGMANTTDRAPTPGQMGEHMSVNGGMVISTGRAPSPLPTGTNMSVNTGMASGTMSEMKQWDIK